MRFVDTPKRSIDLLGISPNLCLQTRQCVVGEWTGSGLAGLGLEGRMDEKESCMSCDFFCILLFKQSEGWWREVILKLVKWNSEGIVVWMCPCALVLFMAVGVRTETFPSGCCFSDQDPFQNPMNRWRLTEAANEGRGTSWLLRCEEMRRRW